MDEWMDGWMEYVDGWMDGWVDDLIMVDWYMVEGWSDG